jgi:hypothetical protein
MAFNFFSNSNKVQSLLGVLGVATLALSFLVTPNVEANGIVRVFNNAGSIPVNNQNRGEISVCIDGTQELNLIPFGQFASIELTTGTHSITVTSLTRSSIDGSVLGACSTINDFSLITSNFEVLDNQSQDVVFSGSPTLLDPRNFGLYEAGSSTSSVILDENLVPGSPRDLRVTYPDYMVVDGPEQSGRIYGPLYQTAQFCMEVNGVSQIITGTLNGNSIVAAFAPQGPIPNNTDIVIFHWTRTTDVILGLRTRLI